jgi:uroporphyrinogen-III synthase
MINLPKHIICTRKINLENKSLAIENGFFIDDYDFLSIQHLCTNELLKTLRNSTVKAVFTSMHAVESVYACLQQNKLSPSIIHCYVVQGRTSNLAQQYNFHIIATAKNGQSLAESIIQNNETSLVHFTTVDARKEMEDALTKHSIDYQKIMVYEKTINSISISKPFDGIMFFSPSQVDGFLKSNKLDAIIPAFCIGETTKAHLKNYHHQNIHIAESADELVLVKTVIDYFNNNTL